MSLTVNIAKIRELGPCGAGYAWALRHFKKDEVTASEARDAGLKFDDLAWYLSSRAPHEPEIDRRLRMWRADCAAHILHVYERAYPGDYRPREAIIAAREFASGKCGPEYLAACIARAHSAANAAWDAKRIRAGQAADAARICGEQRAAWVVIGCVVNCLRETAEAERGWTYSKLVEWFTEGSEPEPLALGERAA